MDIKIEYKPTFVIGFTGKAGNGKSFAAYGLLDIMVNAAVRVDKHAFADSVKQQAACIFQLPEMHFYHRKNEIAKPYNKTYRELLQLYGTDFARNMIDKYFWVNLLNIKIINSKPPKNYVRHTGVIIDDVRFPEEAQYIRDLGGYIVQIDRGIDSNDSHESENQVIEPDFIIDNSGTEKELEKQLRCLFNTIEKHRLKKILGECDDTKTPDCTKNIQNSTRT